MRTLICISAFLIKLGFYALRDTKIDKFSVYYFSLFALGSFSAIFLAMTNPLTISLRTALLCFLVVAAFSTQKTTAQAQQLPSKTVLVLNSAVHSPAPFLAHSGSGAFDSYLTMNLPFAPIETLWKSLEKAVETPLKNRGEAHITVVSPPEFTGVLSKVLTIQEINEIATSLRIQTSRFKAVCMGRAQVALDGKAEQAYYVVVQSEDLLNIRRAIFRKYCIKGGEPSLWDPEHFYPHITVGFTKQDLHEESNGVRKGANSCFMGIVE